MNALKETISAIFPHIENVNQYNSSKLSLEPKNDFPITVNSKGETVSRYGDNRWDLSSYLQNNKKVEIKFDKIKNSTLISEAKLLMFYVMIYGREKKGGLYSAKYLSGNYFNQALYPLAVFALKNAISIKEVFKGEALLKRYISSFIESKPNLIRPLSSLLDLIYRVDSLKDYKPLAYKSISGDIKKHKQKLLFLEKQNFKQTPIIPTSIFNKSLQERWEHIEYFEKHISKLCRFIKKLVKTKYYGMGCTSSIRFNAEKTKRLNIVVWREELEQYHGLKNFFEKYKERYCHGRGKFHRILNRFQGTCLNLILAYSGMRREEALSLTNDCILFENIEGVKILKVIGVTTKLEGQAKKTKWVTSKEIERVINLLVKLNKAIYHNQKVNKDTIPLFASTYPVGSPREYSKLKHTATNGVSFELPLSSEAIAIKEEDVKELEDIDYFRDWKDDEEFKVGNSWSFKAHQYRRSLAVYSIQSGLVSLGGLQIQLKHLFKEMTLYYGKGSSQANKLFNDNGIAKEINQMRPEVEALVYIKNVIFSDEQLHGNHGSQIEETNKNMLLMDDRKKLLSKFKQGEISYKETPLGGCVSIETCDASLTRSLTGCFSCKHGVMKESKLNRAIGKQEEFVSLLDKSSIEYRTENKDLTTLKKYRKKILENKK